MKKTKRLISLAITGAKRSLSAVSIAALRTVAMDAIAAAEKAVASPSRDAKCAAMTTYGKAAVASGNAGCLKKYLMAKAINGAAQAAVAAASYAEAIYMKKEEGVGWKTSYAEAARKSAENSARWSIYFSDMAIGKKRERPTPFGYEKTK